MAATPTLYQLPDNWGLSKGINFLISGYQSEVEPEQRVEHRYLDSFDWRLYGSGWILSDDETTENGQISLFTREAGEIHIQRPEKIQTPALVDDITDPELRGKIANPLAMRALIPQVVCSGRQVRIRLLDDERKTILFLQLEEITPKLVGGSGQKSVSRLFLTLLPLKGYEKVQARMQGYLLEEFDLEPEQRSQLDLVLAAMNRSVDEHSTKLDFQLDPAARADRVTKQILMHLLHTLEDNISGTKANIDSEFLHDLRVAVRRSRSALTQIKGVFPDQVVQEFKEKLAWFGQVTGPVRDLDVYLLGFGSYQETLPVVYQKDLLPLQQYLEKHHGIEQKRLVGRINSPHFRGILKAWRAFLDAPLDEGTETSNGGKPIKSVADKRIYRMFRRVIEEGEAITPDSPPEMLHELRKSCKKLRYLQEFFQSLYPQNAVKCQIKALKRLLDNLGDFQDFEVQAQKLREFAHDMVREGDVPADTLLAMGMLVDMLLKRQQQAHADFSRRFAEFATTENRESYQQLFRGNGRKGSKA